MSEATVEADRISTAEVLHRDAARVVAEMRADAVRGGVLASGRSGESIEDVASLVEIHTEELLADLDQFERIELDPQLADARGRLRESSLVFAGQAERVALSTRRQTEAAATLSEALEASYAQLRSAQEDLSASLRVASDDARASLEEARLAAVRTEHTTTVVVILALLALTVGLNRVGRRFGGLLTTLRKDAEQRRFGGELTEALEMVESESGALEVVERAMDDVSEGRPAELLLADSSVAHLERVASSPSGGAPGCGVDSPWHCPAVRRASALTFASSESLSACPKLRLREGGPRSATCVPVSFMGRALGVLHTTGPEGEPPQGPEAERLTTLATQVGGRIGTLRAFARTELQASTDPLTGLANRRALEDYVRDLVRRQQPFTLAIGDLDHFKDLNDTFGHEAGDRSLRVYSRVLRESIRRDDMAARIGGEEFVVVLSGLEVPQALDVLERHRSRLAEATTGGACPRFTVSFGVTDSGSGDTLEELLRAADRALYHAKEEGRDRVVSDAELPV